MIDNEQIIAAAIQLNGVTFSLPKPARHFTVMHSLDLYLTNEQLAAATQGFLTSKGQTARKCIEIADNVERREERGSSASSVAQAIASAFPEAKE